MNIACAHCPILPTVKKIVLPPNGRRAEIRVRFLSKAIDRRIEK